MKVFLLLVSLLFMVLITVAVLWEHDGALGQRGSDLLLFLEASWVRDLDVAALCGRFIYNLLQFGAELAIRVFWRSARVLFVSRVAAMLSRDLIQNLRPWFLFTREGQLPPALVSHGTNTDRKMNLRSTNHILRTVESTLRKLIAAMTEKEMKTNNSVTFQLCFQILQHKYISSYKKQCVLKNILFVLLKCEMFCHNRYFHYSKYHKFC